MEIRVLYTAENITAVQLHRSPSAPRWFGDARTDAHGVLAMASEPGVRGVALSSSFIVEKNNYFLFDCKELCKATPLTPGDSGCSPTD